jgi:carboxypeptidase Q
VPVQEIYCALVEPNYVPFIGFPLAWTPSTHGAITADVIYALLHSPEDFAKYKGKLQGKIVLMADMRVLEMHTEPEAHRLTAEEIQARTLTPDPSRAGSLGREEPRRYRVGADDCPVRGGIEKPDQQFSF